MLRDAIERKTAKILKEEYGIETPKEIADKLSKDDQDYEDYQIRLTNVGDHKIRVVKVVFNNFGVPEDTLHGPVQTTNGTLGVFVVLVKS